MPTLSRLVDKASLSRYLDEHLPGPPTPVELELHVAGFSNVTVFVTRGNERLVLRRPPGGPLLPTSHDMLREFRYLSALDGKARVPRPIVACDDSDVIGAPFYVMERVEGVVIRDALPPVYDTPAARARLGGELIDALVDLHAVDWRAAGIRGRESGYVQRQVALWSDQWMRTQPRTRALPGLSRVGAWLESHLPESPAATVVHGDYRLENVMFAGDPPRLAAIFDWEMATVGDPLADLAWMLAHWADPLDPASPDDGQTSVMDALRRLTALPGFATPEELASMYAERSSRAVGDLGFYLVLAAYKLAIILEGLYAGYLEGTGSNPDAAAFEQGVPALVERARMLIDRAERGVG
jgi:aminoglycoside phosphotransferase (APT) family kinase protein